MGKLLHQLLARTADKHPERPAVEVAGSRLGYAELSGLSDRLAILLAEQGVGRGDRVGIHLPKSSEMIVSLFGVHKAGAAYVPLDPRSPLTRMRTIAEDCGLAALITDARGWAALEADAGNGPLASAVIVHGETTSERSGQRRAPIPWATLDDVSGPPPENSATADDLAYILYTSGSTGRPKGVMTSHGASRAFVDWATDYFALRPEDRLSNHAPLHFDLSVFDIFAAVKAGACLLPVPEEASIFPLELATFIETQRISVWYSVPSVLCRLVLFGALELRPCQNLEKVLFAGEVFPLKHLVRLQRLLPEARHFNLYGPTETNVCTCYEVPKLSGEDEGPLPIGRASSGDEVWVEKEGVRVPPGEPGEILVSGPSLMSGYWNRPELTARAFVQRRGGDRALRRAYPTGDRGLLRKDGELVFLGRLDDMIKSRGFRIEPGEVEAALQKSPAVAEACVVAVPDELSGGSLAAFVVVEAGRSTDAAELRRHCSRYLPGYMVPSRFDLIDALPRTRTGKVDRKELGRRLG